MTAPYSFQYQCKDGYLHIQVKGTNNPESNRRYIQDLVQASMREGCPNVLVEENLEGARLSVTDIFEVLTKMEAEVRSAIRLAALVDVSPGRSDSNQRFGETVAVNRGISVKTFPSVAQAERWLTGKLTRRAKKK